METPYDKGIPRKEKSRRFERRHKQNLLSLLLVSVGAGGGKLALDFIHAMDGIKPSEIQVIEVKDEYIRKICRDEIKSDLDRLKDATEQVKKDFERTVDQILRIYDHRDRPGR